VRILTARWVFPAARPPIRDGAVGIHAGRIVAVGRRADVVAACAAGERWDLGEAADGAARHSRCEVPTCV